MTEIPNYSGISGNLYSNGGWLYWAVNKQECLCVLVDQSFLIDPEIHLPHALNNSTETVFINGLMQNPDSYSLKNDILQFPDNDLKEGDSILVKYWRTK